MSAVAAALFFFGRKMLHFRASASAKAGRKRGEFMGEQTGRRGEGENRVDSAIGAVRVLCAIDERKWTEEWSVERETDATTGFGSALVKRRERKRTATMQIKLFLCRNSPFYWTVICCMLKRKICRRKNSHPCRMYPLFPGCTYSRPQGRHYFPEGMGWEDRWRKRERGGEG